MEIDWRRGTLSRDLFALISTTLPAGLLWSFSLLVHGEIVTSSTVCQNGVLIWRQLKNKAYIKYWIQAITKFNLICESIYAYAFHEGKIDIVNLWPCELSWGRFPGRLVHLRRSAAVVLFTGLVGFYSMEIRRISIQLRLIDWNRITPIGLVKNHNHDWIPC